MDKSPCGLFDAPAWKPGQFIGPRYDSAPAQVEGNLPAFAFPRALAGKEKAFNVRL